MNKNISRKNIKRLLSKPAQYEYFFKHLDKPGWFDYLNDELKTFRSIPKPELRENGQYIQFPPWWPGQYLIKVASKIPDKVFAVIKKIETDNISALAECAQAILNMPPEFLRENVTGIVNLFDKWLDLEYTGYLDDVATNLFKKYLNLEFFGEACKLLDILSKTKLEKPRGIRFRIEMYYYTDLVDKYLPILIENKPIEVLQIIESRFRKALQSNESKTQYSTFYRSTVENSSETWRHDARDILFEILRDTHQAITKLKPEESKKIIIKYLSEKDTIFERLSIHTIRFSNFDDLAITILTNKNNLHRSDIYHEFVLLLKKKFGILDVEHKKQFITWILEGPTKDNEEDFEKYKRFWQARWLLLLKDHIEKDEDLKDFTYLVDKYKDEFPKIEHPDRLSCTTTFVGPRSPLKKEQMEKMTPAEFIDWAKNKFLPPYDPFEGSPEGVSRMLEEVIGQKPELYVQKSERFLDDGLLPTYLTGLIRGLQNAIKDGKTFDIEPILRFVENPLKFHSDPEAKHDYFEIGKYEWLRRAIASFIEALVRKDEFPLSLEIMDRTQMVLIGLIEKDDDPTEESEKKYGPEAKNMDYVMYCMNSNRGQAMVALMHHALRRARLRPEDEKEKEKGKGPFPPGKRMNEYKQFLADRFKLEKSPSVQSSYGQFLTYLFYLDQEWVKQMKKQGNLLPKSEERGKFWEAHWAGYIGFNYFYNEIYDFLKDDYKKAVGRLIRYKETKENYGHHDNRLAEHLMIAYWRKLEEIDEGGDILNDFFTKTPAKLRSHAIGFLAKALSDEKLTKESDEWQRLKNLWKDRIKKVKDDELVEFAGWLKYCPEDLDDIAHLIEPIIPYLHIGYHGEKLLNFINGQIEVKKENVSHSLYLLNKLLKIEKPDRPTYLRNDIRELIIEILTKASKHKDNPEIAKGINQAVNRLGEIGYYDFGELLVE